MLRVTQTKLNNTNKLNNTSILTEKKVNFKHNRKKQELKKDQIVTAMVGDSMVKDIYVWELSDNNNKVVVKHFRHLERNIAEYKPLREVLQKLQITVKLIQTKY